MNIMSTDHGDVRVNEGEAEGGVTTEGNQYTHTHPHNVAPRSVDAETKDRRRHGRDDVDEAEGGEYFIRFLRISLAIYLVSADETSREITGKFTVTYVEISACRNIPPGESLQS